MINGYRNGRAIACLCAVLLTACDSRVSLSATQSPVESARQVVVSVSEVTFVREGGSEETIEFSPAEEVDLLSFSGAESVLLVDSRTVDEGRYEAVKLKIEGSEQTRESFVVLDSEEELPLFVSEDDDGVISVPADFDIDEDELVAVTIDFNLRASLFETDDGLAYELRPRLRLVEDARAGTVSGAVSSELLAEPNCVAAIYVFSGNNITPDDIDGAGIEPVTSAAVDEVAQNYEIGFLEEGRYTLALTCDADADEPDRSNTLDFARVANVSIEAGRATTNNFE